MARSAKRKPAETFKQAVMEMDDVVIACRDGRHRFDPMNGYRQGRDLIRETICKCGTVKVEKLSPRDGRLRQKAHIKYPPGYLVKGLGRMDEYDRGMVRLLSYGKQFGNI